ncbi:hypothetical protein MMPV_006908 [Pyropia vietnamensis]
MDSETVDDARRSLQWGRHAPGVPPLQGSLATAPHAGDVVGVISPAPAYDTRVGRSFMYGTPQTDEGTPRQLSTSPATLPTPTVAPSPPVPSYAVHRWTPPTQTAARDETRTELQHSLRAAPLALSPSIQQPSPRIKRRRSGSEGGGPLYVHRPDAENRRLDVVKQENWAASGADERPHELKREVRVSFPVSSSSEDEQRHGPAYVQQRRAYWSTVLNDTHRLGGAAGSTDVEEVEAASKRAVGVTTSLLRNEVMYAHPVAPGYSRLRATGGSVGLSGAVPVYGDPHYELRQVHSAIGVYRGGVLKRRADGAVGPVWDGEGRVYARSRCPRGVDGQALDGSGSRGSGSGSGSEGLDDDSPRIHVCSDCPYRFKRAYDLTQHKAAVHAKLRPFSCKKCGKTFGHAGTRSKHYRTIHDGLKLHRCGICERTFSEKGNMRKHMMRSHPEAVIPL